MLRVEEVDEQRIIKSGYGFIEGHTVLCQVPLRFVFIPIKCHA
jgi:hypothetical protein